MGESKRKRQQIPEHRRAGFAAIEADRPRGLEPDNEVEVAEGEGDAPMDGKLAALGEKASRIIRPTEAEIPPVDKPAITMRDVRTAPDPAKSCQTCYHYRNRNKTDIGGLCTESPPMAIVTGMGRNVAGETTMQTEAVFPPVRAVWGCGQWRSKETQ